MARRRKAYRLTKHANGIFYYRLPGAGWKSTGTTTEVEAAVFVDRVRRGETDYERRDLTLRSFLAPYFAGPDCPHVKRVRTDGKSFGEAHRKAMKSLIDRKVLTDPIAERLVSSLRAGDFEDLKARLKDAGHGPRSVNQTLQALKTAFTEAVHRRDLRENPLTGIGRIKYRVNESGVFTTTEIKDMFASSPGPWPDEATHCAFLVLYTLGLRRGELTGLRWGSVDFGNQEVRVVEALVDGRRTKLPKWEKTRTTPLPEVTAQALKAHRARSPFVLPDAFVFTDEQGQPWTPYRMHSRFVACVKALGIDQVERRLRIHSFRHSCHSHLIAASYSVELARAAFGWSSVEVQRGYVHVSGREMAGQARIIDGIFE